VPENEIPDLQFVRFDTGLELTRSIAELAEALRIDLDWIREHTRLGELAGRRVGGRGIWRVSRRAAPNCRSSKLQHMGGWRVSVRRRSCPEN